MRIPKTTKAERNREILSMEMNGVSYNEMARKFSITPQRAQQIARRELLRNQDKYLQEEKEIAKRKGICWYCKREL